MNITIPTQEDMKKTLPKAMVSESKDSVPIQKRVLQFTELMYEDRLDGKGFICVGVIKSYNKWDFGGFKKKKAKKTSKEQVVFESKEEGVEEL